MHPCFLFPLMALVSVLNALPYSFNNYQPEESLRVRERRNNGLQVAVSADSLDNKRLMYGTSKEESHELSGPDRYVDFWDMRNPSVLARALYGLNQKEFQSRSKPRLSDDGATSPLDEGNNRLTHQDVLFDGDLLKRSVQPTMNIERDLLDANSEGTSGVNGDQNNLKKREGPSLSIVNPLDVLRQRMMLDMARRRLKENMDQIQANAEYLKTLGKRSTTLQHSDDAKERSSSSQRRRRHRQEYLNSEEVTQLSRYPIPIHLLKSSKKECYDHMHSTFCFFNMPCRVDYI